MNHLSLTILPDADQTAIRKHDPRETDYGTTEIVVFTMRVGVTEAAIQFDTPAKAYAWLERCQSLLDAATGLYVEDSVPA